MEGDTSSSLIVNVEVKDDVSESLPVKVSTDAITVEEGTLSRCPSQITVEEIAPDYDKISNKVKLNTPSYSQIKLRLRNIFASSASDKKLPKNVRRYYKQQKQLAEAFEEPCLDNYCDPEDQDEKTLKSVQQVVILSLVCNVVLVISKAVASYLSGSLSIISSMVDSATDLVSSIIFMYTTHSIKGTNFYEYPAGKTRLEPVAVIVLSVVMTVASLQLITQSITTIVNGTSQPEVLIPTIVLIGATVIIKFFLFLYCRRVNSPTAKALTQDHRNDVLSNTFALGFGYLGYKVWPIADPLGAILISLYIACGWWRTGSDQVRSLTGHTAQPELLHHLLVVCMNHDQRIQFIDTLRAYHFGNNLLVEAHIVLPPTMTLQEAHDIGELLQQKLEKFSHVERAFVHIDYEYEHSPSDEHKIGQSPRRV